jgi:uridylate kinase
MTKKVIVFSLGGSIIIPDKINTKFLKEFKKLIEKNISKYKFIVVCGGGSLARKYIEGLKDKSNEYQGAGGIAATRANAKFMSCFFNQDPKKMIPISLKEIKKEITKRDIVISGAIDFKPNQTTDSNAAEIAANLKAIFVNLTNVDGLYNKNPKKYKDAKFISEISWKEIYKMANSMKFEPGQHFVLDQISSKIIMENHVPTYILGTSIKNLECFLKEKKFKGTTIQN